MQNLTRKLQDDRVIEPRGQAQQASYSLSHEFMAAKVQSWYDEREMERKKAQETLERGMAEFAGAAERKTGRPHSRPLRQRRSERRGGTIVTG